MIDAPKEVVLITGCSSGIGKALAQAFHRAGRLVYATARNIEALEGLRAEGILVHALDVSETQQINDLREYLQNQGYCVDVLVNNAGFGAMGPSLDITLDVWKKQFEVNLFAPVALIQAFAPDMIKQGKGTIVNIGSISGVVATPFAGAYCASKAALNVATDSLRMELEPLGVRVITVQPGGIRSSFGQQAKDSVSLKTHSFYKPIEAGVLLHANESQSYAMPTEQFAQSVVHKVLSEDCPAVLRLGSLSLDLQIMRNSVFLWLWIIL